MHFLQVTLFIVLLSYMILIIITRIGLIKNSFVDQGNEPTVSIIIPARNEADHLPNCLQSLQDLEYPSNKLEIILINDRSTDATSKLLENFQKSSPHYKIIHIHKLPAHRTGKINALIHGIQKTQGDILLFTDADCSVPPQWVRKMVEGFRTKIGIVSSYIVCDQKGRKESIFTKVQSLDWIFLVTIGMGWAKLNKPFSVFGNNMAILRNAYQESGRLESIGSHPAEDFAVFRNISRKTKYGARFLLDPGCLVFTHPIKSLKTLYYQKKRWVISGRNRGFFSLFFAITTFSIHLLIPFSFLFLNPWWGVFSFIIKCFLDLFLISYPLKKLDRIYLLRYFLFYEFYFFLLTLVTAPLFCFSKSMKWKGSTYKV